MGERDAVRNWNASQRAAQGESIRRLGHARALRGCPNCFVSAASSRWLSVAQRSSYTDGAYMSGDTDICWAGWPSPSAHEKSEIVQQIPGIESRGGGKSWRVQEWWIDLLGAIEYVAQKDFGRILTPHGEVVLIPVEDALVERVYSARKWTGYNEGEDACARKLMTAILTGQMPRDWDEACRIAGSARYRCVEELVAVRSEVHVELEKSRE